MPRPQKSNTNEAATIKIENAFWDLLKTERYADITVLRVLQEAEVNRNSFYYHYRDIDNLAYQAVKHNVEHDVSRAWIVGLLAAFQGNGVWPAVTADAAILPHAERIILCVRSDSSYLKQLITDFLRKVWFDFFFNRQGTTVHSGKTSDRFYICRTDRYTWKSRSSGIADVHAAPCAD